MKIRFITAGVLFAALVSACGHGASHSHGDSDDHAGERSGASEKQEHHHAGAIVFEKAKADAAGVRVAVVRPGDFHGVTVVSGRITAASGGETMVVATVAGVVSLDKPVSEGMAVARGQRVFTIVSSGLQDGDISGRVTVAYRTAKAEYERARKLVADKIITEREYAAAKAEYENAALAYKAVGQSADGRGVAVTSPGGYVKECFVKSGDYVDVGRPMMLMTTDKRLYLRAEVPERYYPVLNRITSAKFRTLYSDRVYDLRELNGRLLSSGKTADGGSSFIPVTFEFDNGSGLVAGAFAEIYLLTDVRRNVISIPVTALTEEQGVFFVYVREDADCYRRQEVCLGDTDGVRTEVVSGLKGGETIVTDGAVHVRLAAAGNSIPGHTHNH